MKILDLALLSSILFMGLRYNAQVDKSVSTEEIEVNKITVKSKEDSSLIFDVVEKMPEFPGGNEALFKFLSDNIVYPKLAKDERYSGKVFVQFVVWKDGSVKDVNVIRGVCQSLDKEAIRVIRLMPDWKPGIQRGKPVNTRFTLPIYFKIDAGLSSKDIEDVNIRAKEMIKDGCKIKTVCKETGLSKEEVKELRNEIK